jgi:hypothetical protein
MFPISLPFDYAIHLDSGDRVRSTRRRSTGTRVRRSNDRRQG